MSTARPTDLPSTAARASAAWAGERALVSRILSRGVRGPDHFSHRRIEIRGRPAEAGCDLTRRYIVHRTLRTGWTKPARRPFSPVLSCTALGFSCPGPHGPGGELLPRLFTRAAGPCGTGGGLFSVTLSVDGDFRRPSPAVDRRNAAWWCPDFPPTASPSVPHGKKAPTAGGRAGPVRQAAAIPPNPSARKGRRHFAEREI